MDDWWGVRAFSRLPFRCGRGRHAEQRLFALSSRVERAALFAVASKGRVVVVRDVSGVWGGGVRTHGALFQLRNVRSAAWTLWFHSNHRRSAGSRAQASRASIPARASGGSSVRRETRAGIASLDSLLA